MIGWCKRNKGMSGFIAALLAIIGWLGAEGTFEAYDRIAGKLQQPDVEKIAAIQEFIAINNNDTHYSYPLNSPVSGNTLFIHWKWAKHTGGAYCYYYVIDGADVENNYYHAPVPGKCNPEGFSLPDKPPGFGFNSSIGIKLPYGIPPGNYTVTYFHLEHDGYHDKYQKWVTYDPIHFEVVADVGED